MILVIADDLTGAVEIGGIAHSYGLQVEVALVIPANCNADVLILVSDTRSLALEKALIVNKQMCSRITDFQPDWVFRKIDSVLRGYVLPELKDHLAQSVFQKAFLLPANPAAGRIIVDGQYYVQGKLISETAFRHDPEFPALDADVMALLKAVHGEVQYLRPDVEEIPKGISIAECRNEEDVIYWAECIERKNTLIAGGAAIFEALLNRSIRKSEHKATADFNAALIVSGTAFRESVLRIHALAQQHKVVYFPIQWTRQFPDKETLKNWLAKAEEVYGMHSRLIIAAADNGTAERTDPPLLRALTAELVKLLFAHLHFKELLIEGGATAFEIFRAMHFTSLVPVQNLAPGVVRCQLKDNPALHITMKPGSYPWPEIINMH